MKESIILVLFIFPILKVRLYHLIECLKQFLLPLFSDPFCLRIETLIPRKRDGFNKDHRERREFVTFSTLKKIPLGHVTHLGSFVRQKCSNHCVIIYTLCDQSGRTLWSQVQVLALPQDFASTTLCVGFLPLKMGTWDQATLSLFYP